MKRRRVLAAVGVSLTLAGCGSRGSAPGDDPGADTPEDTDPGGTDPGGPTETVGTPATDLDGFTLGETTADANPHELRVTNDGDGTRTVNLRITNPGTEETLLARSFSLGVDGEISGELRGPATYEVRVTTSGGGTEHVSTVEYFDTCNTYRTTVTIDANGSMTSRMYRTDAMCPIPPTETLPSETPPPNGFALGRATGDVNPHGLTVRNDGQDARTVELRVTDADTDETLLDRSYTLGAEEAVGGELRGPATYDVRVAVPEAETEHVTTVEYFDTCNSYGTTVRLHPDGRITSETISTLIACEEPTPTPDESG